MGIPKFYRWTSERYPCLSERIKEYQIPEFDNLYLDMNGIIHNCSHPNDEDIHLRIPEQQIFKDIFHYIDFLFKMIKPCKVFFMAIDGVAPRAKMNQQRGRRFRSARLAEDQEDEALRKGETLPSEERFDSNCITPGTEFMARLQEQLKYFVQIKVSTDPLWQRSGLVIYLSGHDVPGEGEHKIMDFIRHIRSKPDYEPVRHCLYGLDADLVMLGLSTHEFQFSLLREEVKFSRPKKPRKGGKRTPKQNNEVTNYDLTNVSIFKNDSDVVISPSELAKANIVTDTKSSIVVKGVSFLEALEKPVEASVPVLPPQMPVKSESNNEIVPPPPDDSRAKGVFKAPLPEKTTFLLLHLSLMRDYIDFEFQKLKESLENHPTIVYDLEKVIDDWILMNILVGNDFVPHLPHFHIVKGALPMLYQIYTDVLPTLDGYINESGVLNLRRFEAFINQLSQFDIETFKETYDDMKYMESKTGKNIVLGEKMFEGFDFGGDEIVEDSLEPMSPELKALAQRTEQEVFGEAADGTGNLCVELFDDDDDYFHPDDSPEMKMEFLQHKRNYYISKLELEKITPQFLVSFCEEFIRAIQWVLLYYYKGVSSWGWYYPYHYAPFCSDLKNFAKFKIEFDIGRPFRPFEQLLAVLPAQSKKLLPGCYQWLMTETSSPIVDFYPQKFEQDLNGKKQDWEAVVLIPFIEELKLLTVMKNEEENLNKEEAHRNSRGTMNLYSYSVEETGPVKSPGDIFPVLDPSHVINKTMDEVTYDPLTLPKGIHPKAKKDVIYQGFPTLKSKSVKAVIEKADIKVFEFVTREESMIINLEDINDDVSDLAALSRKLIARKVWVNWPHLTYAFVTGVLTRQAKFSQDVTGRVVRDENLIGSRVEKEFDSIAKGLVQRHLKCKGMKLGQLNVIIYAKMMEGRKVRCDKDGNVQFDTLWSKLEQPFALKSSMYDEDITEIFYLDKNLASTYIDLYKPGDQVFYLGDKLFGTLGTVKGHDKEKGSVVVDLKVSPVKDPEVNLKSCVGHNSLKSHDYFASYVAAGKCHISSYVLSRLTGTVFVSIEKETKAHRKMLARKAALAKNLASNISPTDDSSSDDDFPALETKKINVGLDLKFNKKNLEVRGYTSKRDGAWFYSRKAVELVNDYVVKFSDFVAYLTRVEKGRDVFEASELFQNNPLERINEMVEWLEDNGVRDLPRIPTNTNLLDDEDIDTVWKYILKHKNPSKQLVDKTWTVPPNLLLKPGIDRGCVPAIPNSTFDILDRVVCVDRGAPIPVGRRGSVVGIQIPQSSEPEQIEESFKSTGAATLMTLIILCDPAPDVFDNPCDFGIDNMVEKLTGNLTNLLRITSEQSTSDKKKVVEKTLSPELRPRLIKLYPYQLLNITQGPSLLRESHKDSKRLQNQQQDFFPMNGHHMRQMNGRREMMVPMQLEFSMAKPVQQPIHILQRPTNTGRNQFDNRQAQLPKQIPQPTQPRGKQSTYAQPLQNAHHAATSTKSNNVLSKTEMAAFLQKQFHANPIANTNNVALQSIIGKEPNQLMQLNMGAQPFTPQTAHHSRDHPRTSSSRPENPDILLKMLSKASDNFNREANPVQRGKGNTMMNPRSHQHHHQSFPRPRLPAPPTSWVPDSQRQQRPHQHLQQAPWREEFDLGQPGSFQFQPTQPRYSKLYNPNNNFQQQTPRHRYPNPNIESAEASKRGSRDKTYQSFEPKSSKVLPQHHFVPLAVARNSASKPRQKNHRLSSSQKQQEQALTVADKKQKQLPKEPEYSTTVETLKNFNFSPTTETTNSNATSSPFKFGSPSKSQELLPPGVSPATKSRLAANFGNN